MTNGQPPPKNCRYGRASRGRQDKEYSKIRDGKDAAHLVIEHYTRRAGHDRGVLRHNAKVLAAGL